MLKMYQKHAHAGSTPDFWEENWESSHFEQAVKFCGVDPLRPLFEKYSRPGDLMLEGGCGMGNYAAYYAARGWHVVGLDFARQTLKTLRQRQSHLTLCCGDVSRLPFADETFDIYYSGGVVEHFEGGAEESLREAHRVLKKDGTLLISVPYYSPLRRMLSPLKTSEWRKVEQSGVDANGDFKGQKFFQYAYRPPEFKKMLAAAGLRVVKMQGYAVLWGLYELPFLNSGNIESNGSKTSQAKTEKQNSSVNIDELIQPNQEKTYLKRLVVSEDETVPVAGTVVKFMRWACANMMMYVCQRA